MAWTIWPGDSGSGGGYSAGNEDGRRIFAVRQRRVVHADVLSQREPAGWCKAETVLVLTVKAATHEIAGALVVLAMVVFLLGTPGALARATPSVAQQASALAGGQSLCGHGQTPVACHAPAGCCRPDQPLEPPRRLLPAPPAAGLTTVAYASFRDGAAATSTPAAFHSRAPPA